MLFIYLLFVYVVIGAIVSAWFAFYKVTRIDHAAKGTSFWFKILLLPAGILLWPVVLYKLTTLKKHHEQAT
jgi:hypothetical protein